MDLSLCRWLCMACGGGLDLRLCRWLGIMVYSRGLDLSLCRRLCMVCGGGLDLHLCRQWGIMVYSRGLDLSLCRQLGMACGGGLDLSLCRWLVLNINYCCGMFTDYISARAHYHRVRSTIVPSVACQTTEGEYHSTNPFLPTNTL